MSISRITDRMARPIRATSHVARFTQFSTQRSLRIRGLRPNNLRPQVVDIARVQRTGQAWMSLAKGKPLKKGNLLKEPKADPAIRVAIFDVDDTIIDENTGRAFVTNVKMREQKQFIERSRIGRFLANLGGIGRGILFLTSSKAFLWSGMWYGLGKLLSYPRWSPFALIGRPLTRRHERNLIRNAVEELEGYTVEELNKLADMTVDNFIESELVNRGAILAILKHALDGHKIALASGAPVFIIRALGRRLGIPEEDCIGSQPVVADGEVTGQVKFISFRLGKREVVLDWLKGTGYDRENVHFYSDNKRGADNWAASTFARFTKVGTESESAVKVQPGHQSADLFEQTYSTRGTLLEKEWLEYYRIMDEIQNLEIFWRDISSLGALKDKDLEVQIDRIVLSLQTSSDPNSEYISILTDKDTSLVHNQRKLMERFRHLSKQLGQIEIYAKDLKSTGEVVKEQKEQYDTLMEDLSDLNEQLKTHQTTFRAVVGGIEIDSKVYELQEDPGPDAVRTAMKHAKMANELWQKINALKGKVKESADIITKKLEEAQKIIDKFKEVGKPKTDESESDEKENGDFSDSDQTTPVPEG